MTPLKKTAAVIGGGFFGCMIAKKLARRFQVYLIEQENDLLARASYVNQARVHHGYHYPRSILTAARSRVNYQRFIQEFHDCIDGNFEKYYAIAKQFSNISARQFTELCLRIGMPIDKAPKEILEWFDQSRIEAVFRVEEVAFNARKLRERLSQELEEANVKVLLQTRLIHLESDPTENWQLHLESDLQQTLTVDIVLNCTYSGLNSILEAAHLPLIPLKHELAEMALVQMPEPLRRFGVTVMCGPFFSIMPFPDANLHSFSHVRYTPHGSWNEDAQTGTKTLSSEDFQKYPSHFARMLQDASRYMPILNEVQYQRSIWEIKTVLPRNEKDDGRPILFRTETVKPNFHSILGAKIDNVYDILDQVEAKWMSNQGV